MLLKKKKNSKYIVDMEISSDSDRENSDEEYLTEKILVKKIKKY